MGSCTENAIRRTRSHSFLFRVSLGVLAERQNPLRIESVAECGRTRNPLGTRRWAHNTRRGKIFHDDFSLSIKETDGVDTIVRNSCLPIAAKQRKRHTVLRRCEAAQGCRPRGRAHSGICRREKNTYEVDHEAR